MFPNVKLKFADHGARHPAPEKQIINQYTNGKIIYTIDKNYCVLRDYLFSRDGGSHGHRKQLTIRLINSIYYEDASFSWYDFRKNHLLYFIWQVFIRKAAAGGSATVASEAEADYLRRDGNKD